MVAIQIVEELFTAKQFAESMGAWNRNPDRNGFRDEKRDVSVDWACRAV